MRGPRSRHAATHLYASKKHISTSPTSLARASSLAPALGDSRFRCSPCIRVSSIAMIPTVHLLREYLPAAQAEMSGSAAARSLVLPLAEVAPQAAGSGGVCLQLCSGGSPHTRCLHSKSLEPYMDPQSGTLISICTHCTPYTTRGRHFKPRPLKQGNMG